MMHFDGVRSLRKIGKKRNIREKSKGKTGETGRGTTGKGKGKSVKRKKGILPRKRLAAVHNSREAGTKSTSITEKGGRVQEGKRSKFTSPHPLTPQRSRKGQRTLFVPRDDKGRKDREQANKNNSFTAQNVGG